MKVSPHNKPLPEISEFSRPFWEGALHGQLKVQECTECHTRDFLPKPWCVECGSRSLIWKTIRGQGEIYSFTVATAVMMNLPGWKEELPLVLGLIDLDEGPRLYGQIVGVGAQTLQIGMRVEPVFERISDEAGIVKFRLVA